MNFLARARELEPQITAWRRDIHMHPELGFEETRTARLVADTLREIGLEVETGVGITGVVARIGDGNGPNIGIRADMDALPIQEANEVAYKSQTPGVMHACGHDAHTAILLGVATMLHEMPNRPAGQIRLLFQPSEERADAQGKSGATRMIEDQALENLDAVIGLHVHSLKKSGTVHITAGYVTAAVDSFEATITGIGCHGAAPESGIDPIYIQAQVINAIQGIRARRLKPTEPSVITVSSVHGGDAFNIIPDSVSLRGTLRSYNEETRSNIHVELENAFSVAQALGGDYTLKIMCGPPGIYNTPEVSDVIHQVSLDSIGEANTLKMEPMMGAGDFAFMVQKAPGAMVYLGAKKDAVNRPHHSPLFDIDESALPVGAAVLAETAIRLMAKYA